jgi:hypothetical protein
MPLCMSSRIFDRFGRPVPGHDDIKAEAVDVDEGATTPSTLELIEAGVDVVEEAQTENVFASELARQRSSLWVEETRIAMARSVSDPTQLIVEGRRQLGSGARDMLERQDRARPLTPRMADAGQPQRNAWVVRIGEACRALFAAIIDSGHDEDTTARMTVDEVLRIDDGRTVCIGQLSGRARFAQPSLWWLVIEGKRSIVTGSEVDVVTSNRHGPSRAIAIREHVDAELIRKHVGAIELVEIKDR